MPAQDGLRFLFDIQDKISAKLAKIEKNSKASAKRIDQAFTRASRSQEKNAAAFEQSMTQLASAATVAFGAVAARSLSMAGGYDKAMRSVQAKTQASAADMERLTGQSREMGRTMVHSATEAARGQAFLAQAGFDVNEVLAALPGTLNLATAGELGLARAADIASNVLTGFNLNVSEADRVADVLALTAQSTNTNVQQMGDAMKFAAAVAEAAEADFEETAAAIGLLANAGLQGTMGGTALRGAMSKLLNPTKAAQKILDKLGISAVTSTGALRPLHDIVGQFEDVGLTAGDAMKIFGQRAGPGMLALVSQGSGALVELTAELKNAEGTAEKTADIMAGGLWGALKKFQSITESAFISFGERLAPAVVWGANVFAALPGPIQEVVVVTGSMVAAMGGLMLVMPKSFGSLVQLPRKLAMLVTSINLVRVKTIAMAVAQKAATAAQWLMNAAMTANPIGLIIAAIALLVVAWLKWDDEIKAFLKVTWGKVVKAFNAFKGIARDVYKGIRLWLGDRLGAIFKGIRDKVEWVVGLFTDMKDAVVGHSIVPDMVDDLDAEFQRLGEVMIYETAAATDAVVTKLEDLTEESTKAADATRQLADEQQAGTESASGYDLALAGLAGQMGGATGQALNLVIAMREHNTAQRAAAEAGRETEGEFSKMQVGAATLGLAFTAIGDAIGGTAGKVLSELGGIAQAFATGGVVAGIMAGIGSLVKGIKGLFGRGKKKREKAAAEEKARLAEVAAAAEAAAERMRAAAEKAAAEIKAYWDTVYNATISAFDQAKAAGIAAYDEIYLAAIESGINQADAMQLAASAQIATTNEILRVEGEKFARLAAFEAALAAIRSGNAAGAADAAALAAAQTRAAWETAMDAVTAADQAAGDSMIDTANKVAAIQEKQAAAAAAAQVAAAEAAKNAWTWEPPSQGDDEIPGFQDPPGYDGFQHGGPVQAGKPILVGEAGPELFIPSQGGRIDPNVSSAGGGVNAKELAAAVSEALQNTRIEVDGRQLGRLTIRHQPIAVAELGGRR